MAIKAVQTLSIGDDLNDYAAMNSCEFKGCPSDAAKEIRGVCDYVSPINGGRGAVRDILEHLLKGGGQWAIITGSYGVTSYE